MEDTQKLASPGNWIEITQIHQSSIHFISEKPPIAAILPNQSLVSFEKPQID